MTLSTTSVRSDYAGSGSTGPFAFAFKIFDASHLTVTKRNAAGVESTLAYPTDYTVTGVGATAGGAVTLGTALATGEHLTIRRVMPLTQTTDFRNQGSFLPASEEDELDRQAMGLQGLNEQVQRSFKLGPSLDAADYSLEVSAPVAGRVLTATDDGIEWTILDSGATSLPASGRTVDTVSGYLLHNALYNVKDYGAVGDGSSHPLSGSFASLAAAQAVYPAAAALTDELDWCAIRTAIAAATSGGTIFFPAGEYVLHVELPATANLTFLGEGKGCTEIRTTVNNAPVFAVADGVDGLTWQGLTLSSPSGTPTVLGRGVITGNSAGTTAGLHDWQIVDCHLNAGSCCGVTVNKMIHGVIRNTTIDNLGTGEHGIYLSAAGADCDDVTVEDCRLTSSATSHLGIQMRGGTNITLRGIRIEGFDASVLACVGTSTTDLTLHDIQCVSPGTDGFQTFDAVADRLQMTMIRVYQPGRNGIRFLGGIADAQVSNILVHEPGESGIRLQNCSNSDLSNLRVRDADKTGDGANADTSSGLRLVDGNSGLRFVNVSVTASNAATHHKYALSVGGTFTDITIRDSRFDAGRTGTYDIANVAGGVSFDGLKFSTTWNPSSVAAGAQTTTTLSGCSGALVGDRVTVGFSNDLQGMTLTGYVSSAEVVTVVLRNGTGGAIDLASGTLTATINQL